MTEVIGTTMVSVDRYVVCSSLTEVTVQYASKTIRFCEVKLFYVTYMMCKSPHPVEEVVVGI